MKQTNPVLKSLDEFKAALKAILENPEQRKRLEEALDSTRGLPTDLRIDAIKSKLSLN